VLVFTGAPYMLRTCGLRIRRVIKDKQFKAFKQLNCAIAWSKTQPIRNQKTDYHTGRAAIGSAFFV